MDMILLGATWIVFGGVMAYQAHVLREICLWIANEEERRPR